MSIKHLNQRQLADRWNVSEAILERWRSKGIGPVFLKIRGRVLYRVEDVESYEAKCLRKSTSERVGVEGNQTCCSDKNDSCDKPSEAQAFGLDLYGGGRF